MRNIVNQISSCNLFADHISYRSEGISRGERIRNEVIKENEKLPMNRKHWIEILETQEIRDLK